MSGKHRPAPRRPAWRTVLSALAGSGLTAAGLVGPLSAALGAEPASTTATETGQPPGTTTGIEAGETTTSTTTAEGATTPSPAPAPATTTTSSTPASTTNPATTTEPATTTPVTVPSAPGSGRRKAGSQGKQTTATRPTKSAASGTSGPGGAPAAGKSDPNARNNVALPPQLVAGQAGALAAMLRSSAVSTQALDFYRIPLFLLPIYRAAAAQYDVPWQILAAINEIETNYGTDLSVSSAGAVGWMQFMPQTWLEYGVDALNAGYADPYNPVDAIFAAARYLNAAGAAQNLSTAILAYNHSQEYLESVMLRAKLIASYPGPVIATLTGLVDDRPPITGKQLGVSAPAAVQLPSHSSATAGASAVPATAQSAGAAGPAAAPAPANAAGSATGTSPQPAQVVDIATEPNARVVAVQDGRVVKLGSSRKLGRYVVLQDVYGDEFTYSRLGSITTAYVPPRWESAAEAAARHTGHTSIAASSPAGAARAASDFAPAGGKVRVYAHPGNPDELLARARAGSRRPAGGAGLPLHQGSVIAQGTVLGRVDAPAGAQHGHLRFAIRPAGDATTIDPRAILQSWQNLGVALHPQGSKGQSSLLGATASDVFLLSKSRLEREVLSDPGIAMSSCSRQEVAAGKVDARALAVLAFLSRSGLKPAVGTLACGGGAYAASGYVSPGHSGDAVAIVAINGVPIAGHQGAGSITDTTIRTLLTLQDEFFPARIVSLMHYPGAPTTIAKADHGDYLEVVFSRSVSPADAHAAVAGRRARSATIAGLSSSQWEQLIARVAALPVPKVSAKPSSAAILDAKSAQAAGGGSGSSSG